MTLSIDVLKDDLGQEIIEGNLCIVHHNRHSGFEIAFVVESRKKVKVAMIRPHWQTKVDEIYYEWYYQSEVLMFNEDNLFRIMDGQLLHKMAMLRAATAEMSATILAKKEKKRTKLTKEV